MSVCLLSLLFFAHAQASTPLFDEVGRNFQPHLWEFAVQTDYYQATANYTPGGGQFASLNSGFSYNLLAFDFGARWVPTSPWGLYANAQVANAESKNSIDTRRNSSFTQVNLGSDYLLFNGQSWQVYPDFSVLVPVDRVDVSRDDVLNHEGALEVSARMVGRVRWKHLAPFAFLGFNYRDENRASLLPYGVGTEYLFSSWSLGGELRGHSTAIKDKSNITDSQRTAQALRNGGALKFDSTDPALLETHFWFKKVFAGSFALKLGGGTSITGANTSAGWDVFALLSYSFVGNSNSRSSSPAKSQARPGDNDAEKFQEETNDGVNQNLFYAPASDPAQPPPASKQKQKADEKKNLQNEMDRTEFQIELKSVKKKKRSTP